MKTNHLHYIVLLATIFLGCSCSEEIEKELTTGKTAVTIEVDGEEDVTHVPYRLPVVPLMERDFMMVKKDPR